MSYLPREAISGRNRLEKVHHRLDQRTKPVWADAKPVTRNQIPIDDSVVSVTAVELLFFDPLWI